MDRTVDIASRTALDPPRLLNRNLPGPWLAYTASTSRRRGSSTGISRRTRPLSSEVEMKKLREEPNLQQIVDEGDLENHLSHGWEFVSTLPSGKIQSDVKEAGSLSTSFSNALA